MPTVECPKCARGLRIQSAAIGKKVKCPGCGSRFQVPGEDEEEECGSASRSGKRTRARMPGWALALILIGGGILLILVICGTLGIAYMREVEVSRVDAARLRELNYRRRSIEIDMEKERPDLFQMTFKEFQAKNDAFENKRKTATKVYDDEVCSILARHPDWTEDGPRK